MSATLRRAVATALLVLTLGVVVGACSDDSSSGKVPPTTRSEDMPNTGPQSGTNPAGGEPVNGTTPPG